MKYLIGFLIVLFIGSCSGVLYEGDSERSTGSNTTTITIRLFENDPLWAAYGEIE